MRCLIWFAVSLFFSSAALADTVGVVTSVSGEVRILRDGNYLAAGTGVDVATDDIVETGKLAAAQLDMEDGSSLKLGPETRLAISEYHLDASKNVVAATLDVISGWLRFAVAKIKNKGSYRFDTPVLTVGVRGTEGTIEAENERGGLHLEHGAVDVFGSGKEYAGRPPVRVVTGEYIQGYRGKPLAKSPVPPAAFQKRVPLAVQNKLERQVQDLKQRNVPPKLIRAITNEDAKRFVERYPHLNKKLRERFRPEALRPQGKGEKNDAVRPGIGGQVLRDRELRGEEGGSPESPAGRKGGFVPVTPVPGGAPLTPRPATPMLNPAARDLGTSPVAPGTRSPLLSPGPTAIQPIPGIAPPPKFAPAASTPQLLPAAPTVPAKQTDGTTKQEEPAPVRQKVFQPIVPIAPISPIQKPQVIPQQTR
jgi:hypothetical protein